MENTPQHSLPSSGKAEDHHRDTNQRDSSPLDLPDTMSWQDAIIDENNRNPPPFMSLDDEWSPPPEILTAITHHNNSSNVDEIRISRPPTDEEFGSWLDGVLSPTSFPRVEVPVPSPSPPPVRTENEEAAQPTPEMPQPQEGHPGSNLEVPPGANPVVGEPSRNEGQYRHRVSSHQQRTLPESVLQELYEDDVERARLLRVLLDMDERRRRETEPEYLPDADDESGVSEGDANESEYEDPAQTNNEHPNPRRRKAEDDHAPGAKRRKVAGDARDDASDRGDDVPVEAVNPRRRKAEDPAPAPGPAPKRQKTGEGRTVDPLTGKLLKKNEWPFQRILDLGRILLRIFIGERDVLPPKEQKKNIYYWRKVVKEFDETYPDLYHGDQAKCLVACQNHWNRTGRAHFGYDERTRVKDKNAGLSTSLQKNRRKKGATKEQADEQAQEEMDTEKDKEGEEGGNELECEEDDEECEEDDDDEDDEDDEEDDEEGSEYGEGSDYGEGSEYGEVEEEGEGQGEEEGQGQGEEEGQGQGEEDGEGQDEEDGEGQDEEDGEGQDTEDLEGEANQPEQQQAHVEGSPEQVSDAGQQIQEAEKEAEGAEDQTSPSKENQPAEAREETQHAPVRSSAIHHGPMPTGTQDQAQVQEQPEPQRVVKKISLLEYMMRKKLEKEKEEEKEKD